MLARKIDEKKKYSSLISTISKIKVQNNARCQGADQQSGNYMYRIVELTQVITNVFMDEEDEKAARRLEEYWEAHSEEKAQLINERAELNKKIAEIKKQAAEINAEQEIAPLRKKINELTYKMNSVSTSAVSQATKKLKDKQDELSATGFFKFSLRKKIKAEIEELVQQKVRAESAVKKEQEVYRREIEGVQKRIDALNEDVKKKQNAVLLKKNPHENRILKINAELTKPR